MNAPVHTTPSEPLWGQVVDFVQSYIQRALRDRARYRYVHPMVWSEGDAFRVEAPCCSRNVDPTGGVIDIALLRPGEDGQWELSLRDHVRGEWELHGQGLSLGEALAALCTDPERKFWP